MFLALELGAVSDISISPAGGEPTATPHGAAGAARAADVPAGSATPARTPAAMPQGAAGTAPSGFASGRRQLESAIKKRRWPDGKPLGRGHSAPYLQPEYAAAIVERRKTLEGRPGGGWVHGKRGRMIAVDDYVRFKVVGQPEGLSVRVKSVAEYPTFAAMISGVGVKALLPDADAADVAGAVARYHAFGNQRGTYAALEAEYGAVAIGVKPLL